MRAHILIPMSLEKPPNSGFHSFVRAQHKIRYALRLHIIKSVSVYSVAGAVVKVVALALALSKHRVCRHARGASVWARRVPNGRRDLGYEKKNSAKCDARPNVHMTRMLRHISHAVRPVCVCVCVCSVDLCAVCVECAAETCR